MKTNSIYEALNNVDDKFVSEAAKVRGKRPVALVVTAASLAAALALAVGIRYWGGIIGNYISPADSPVNQSGVSYEASGFGESDLGNDKYKVTVNGRCEYFWDVYAYNITIPEKFRCDDIDNCPNNSDERPLFRNLKMRPDEIFAEFGVSPLMNENFLDVSDIPPHNDYAPPSDGYYEEPLVFLGGSYISFEYYLYNKSINKNVKFRVEYPTADSKSGGSGWNSGGKYFGAWDTITMKDGSVGFVMWNSAMFSNNAVRYYLTFSNPDTDDINQVLADLGVL